MKRSLAPLALLALASTAQAQVSPTPSFDDPRMQSVVYRPGEAIRLTAFPDASLMLVLHQGETIRRVVVSDGAQFKAAVVGGGDTIELVPAHAGATAELRVQTDQQNYNFDLATGSGLAAAYVVRLVPGEGEPKAPAASQPQPGAETWTYRVKGDRSVRPDSISDDGTRTYLSWGRNRALPAVFGIGPGGDEELVAGYMRKGVYVIDRVYPELIFRFDKEKAEAKRDERQE